MQARKVAVVGAGIVGMSVALALQSEGHAVTVYDPAEPGSGCSFGNSGIIATELSLPVLTPSLLWQIPRMLLDREGPLVIRPSYLPMIAGWLGRLILATRPARFRATADALARLLDFAVPAFDRLLTTVRGHSLHVMRGRLIVYSEASTYANAAAQRAEWDRRSIRYQVLTVDQTLALEPSLAPVFDRAIFLPDSTFISDPAALVGLMADWFVTNGGTMCRAAVHALPLESGVRRVVTEESRTCFENVVVAAGAWSRPLCRSIGMDVPLETERGYHVVFPGNDSLTRPVLWADRYTHLVPMRQGIRLTSGVEFAGLRGRADFRRIKRLATRARTLLPSLGEMPTSPWLGFRPTLADSLPMLGRVPAHDDVILCFGHQHLGLTLGPISGRIVSDLIADRRPPLDLHAFRVNRSFLH